MIEAVEKCTGCLACYNACPINAIYIKQDEKGFYKPRIDSDRCTLCGKCHRACPEVQKQAAHAPAKQIYAAWSKDEKLRAESTSGGVFTGLAQEIISQGGMVFGAAMDEEFNVVHKSAGTIEGLEKFRRSKYVQSYVGMSYREAEKELKNGRKVLFSGTPCQLAGLKGYLRQEYDRLLTVDVVCHGVPSPMLFKAYLDYIEKTFGKAPVKEINFRDKEKSWVSFCMDIKFLSGKRYRKNLYQDPYLAYFIGNYCLCEACYSCQYASLQRQGDITLGDFWGYKSENCAVRNDGKGISLVMVNTEKGSSCFNAIQAKYKKVEKTVKEAAARNTLTKPSEKNEKYDAFWMKFLKTGSFDECLKHFPIKRRLKIKTNIFNLYCDTYYLVPNFIKNNIDAWHYTRFMRKTDD